MKRYRLQNDMIHVLQPSLGVSTFSIFSLNSALLKKCKVDFLKLVLGNIVLQLGQTPHFKRAELKYSLCRPKFLILPVGSDDLHFKAAELLKKGTTINDQFKSNVRVWSVSLSMMVTNWRSMGSIGSQ